MSEKHISARLPGFIFAICLGVSIGMHVVSVLMVAYIWSAPSSTGNINYLEIGDLVASPLSKPVATISKRADIQESSLRQQLKPEPLMPDPVDPVGDMPKPAAVGDVMATPLGLGMTYGFVSSLGDGATLREDIREYYLVMVEKINKVWWERAGTLPDSFGRDGIAVIVIQRDGTLVDRGIRRGTGSVETDRALLESIDKASPLPPLPSSYGQDVFTAPLKITAPSRLLRVTNYK